MKKFYAILAAICLLSACSGGKGASFTETTVAETAAIEETTAVPEAAEYTIHYEERRGNPSKEQDRLYEFLSENWSCDELIKEIDLFRVRMSELSDDYSLPDEYTVYADEYFADFDGDGNGELYVCRNTSFYSEVPLAEYRELWYTDGESCIQVYSGGGLDILYGGICEPQGGIPLMYVVPEVYTSSAFQSADVYFIKDGKPVLYELPKSEYFLYGGERLFIETYGKSEYKELADAFDKTRDAPDGFQTIGWVDGELKIISGYGAENT